MKNLTSSSLHAIHVKFGMALGKVGFSSVQRRQNPLVCIVKNSIVFIKFVVCGIWTLGTTVVHLFLSINTESLKSSSIEGTFNRVVGVGVITKLANFQGTSGAEACERRLLALVQSRIMSRIALTSLSVWVGVSSNVTVCPSSLLCSCMVLNLNDAVASLERCSCLSSNYLSISCLSKYFNSFSNIHWKGLSQLNFSIGFGKGSLCVDLHCNHSSLVGFHGKLFFNQLLVQIDRSLPGFKSRTNLLY